MTHMFRIEEVAHYLRSSINNALSVGIVGAGEVAIKVRLPVLTALSDV